MKTIEQEAEEWIKNTSEHLSVKNGFIAGANSKHVQRQILQSQLKENESVLQMLKLHGNARNRLPIIGRITELQEKLNEL